MIAFGDELGDPAVSHSSTLLSDIASTLKAANVALDEVDLLAAASGPGSFTGLRIGVASLKALSITLGRPSFGIPTLHALAHSAGPSKATLAVLPAGRAECNIDCVVLDSGHGQSSGGTLCGSWPLLVI